MKRLQRRIPFAFVFMGFATIFTPGLAQSTVNGVVITELGAKADAEHVAVAATHGLKFLLTWNCRHLANEVLRPKMMYICIREGYTCPRIVTPDEIMRLRTHV